jgi:hypothetical protein
MIPRQLFIGLDPETRSVERFEWHDDATAWKESAGPGGPPVVLFRRMIARGRVILQPENHEGNNDEVAQWIPAQYWPEAFRLMADRELIPTGTTRLTIRAQEIEEANHESRVAMFATGFARVILCAS